MLAVTRVFRAFMGLQLGNKLTVKTNVGIINVLRSVIQCTSIEFY